MDTPTKHKEALKKARGAGWLVEPPSSPCFKCPNPGNSFASNAQPSVLGVSGGSGATKDTRRWRVTMANQPNIGARRTGSRSPRTGIYSVAKKKTGVHFWEHAAHLWGKGIVEPCPRISPPKSEGLRAEAEGPTMRPSASVRAR